MTGAIRLVAAGVLAIIGIQNFPTSLAQTRPQTSASQTFHWNWRDGQELTANQSLRNARLSPARRRAIANTIANQIRPMMADLEIATEAELQNAALDTRVASIDVDGDGIAEVVAQGMVNCGATGNCPFWIFRRSRSGYDLILEGEAQTFTIQRSRKTRFRDIVLSRHGSAAGGDLAVYEYSEGRYRQVACYGYDWEVLEGEKVRRLREPRLSPCSEER